MVFNMLKKKVICAYVIDLENVLCVCVSGREVRLYEYDGGSPVDI